MKLLDISTPKYPNTFTLLDDADFDWASQWKWHPNKNRGTFYVERVGPGGVPLKLHRELLKPAPGLFVDHRDGNGLNNQRENLRAATRAQNSQNVRKQAVKGASQFKGLWRKNSRWAATIYWNGKSKYLGSYLTEIEAALAYNKAALEMHGEFAHLNQIPDLDLSDPFLAINAMSDNLEAAAMRIRNLRAQDAMQYIESAQGWLRDLRKAWSTQAPKGGAA